MWFEHREPTLGLFFLIAISRQLKLLERKNKKSCQIAAATDVEKMSLVFKVSEREKSLFIAWVEIIVSHSGRVSNS